MKKHLALLSGVLLLNGCALTNLGTSPLRTSLTGNWHESNSLSCSDNYHTVSFNNTVMEVSYAKEGAISKNERRKSFLYDILSEDDDKLRVQLINETRFDKKGRRVIWHIKQVNENQYCWGRDDWRPDGCTAPRNKCSN